MDAARPLRLGRTSTLLVACALGAVGCGGSDGGMDASAPDLEVADLADAIDLSMTSGMCSVTLQDCPRFTDKCQLITPPVGASFGRCAPNGTVAADQPCTVAASTGVDDCQKFLVCSGLGLGPGVRACRQLCSTDGTCTAGQLCHTLSDGLAECVPSCVAFAGTCAAGLTCAALDSDVAGSMAVPLSFLSCRAVGPGAPFTPCQVDADCATDALCNTKKLLCVPLCDNNHVCTIFTDGGSSCSLIGGLPTGGGACH